jgi:hypothetical protein
MTFLFLSLSQNGPSEKQKETEKNFETLSANPPISDLNPPISIESKTDTTDDKNIIKEVNSDRLEIINQANSDNKVASLTFIPCLRVYSSLNEDLTLYSG